MKPNITNINENLAQVVEHIDKLFNHRHMDMTIMAVDLTGKCVYANDLVKRFLGIFEGTDLENSIFASSIFKAMEKYEVVKTIRKIPLKDWTIHVDITSFPLVINGEVIGGVGLGLNITEQIELKNSLVNTERISLVGEMAERIIYELRNPVQMMRFALKEIEHEHAGGNLTDEKLVAKLKHAHMALDNLNEKLRDVVEYSQPKGSVSEDFKLEGFLKEMMNFFADTLERQDVDWGINLEADLTIYGDKKLLKHALMNLIQNAIEVLKDYDGKRFLEIEGKVVETEVLLIIYNTGPAIEERPIEKIFDLFYSTKDKPGTGLGLPIARDIIESNHCGKIWCESSKELGGTRFLIILPSSGGKKPQKDVSKS